MDVIASAFFGIKIDSQNDPNNAFTKNASEAFNFSLLNPIFIIYCKTSLEIEHVFPNQLADNSVIIDNQPKVSNVV
jgi:hypothetical protein